MAPSKTSKRTAAAAAAVAVLGVLVACLAGGARAGGPVVQLGKENFDELTASGAWLLEFYAPWCGHCKALAPVYEEVALAAPAGTQLATIDCTEERELQRRFGIKGFPTLLFLRDGEQRPYRSRRDKESILSFLEAMNKEPVQEATKKTRKRLTRDYVVNFLFAGAEQASDEYAMFERVARAHQARQGFLRTEDAKLIKAVGATAAAEAGPVVVQLSEGGDNQRFEGPWDDYEALKAWVSDNQLPLVSELDATNFYDLTGSGRPTVFAVTNSEAAGTLTKEYLSSVFLGAARANNDRFVFANLDAAKYHGYVSQFDLDLDNGPTAFVFDFPNERYWSPKPAEGYTAGNRQGLDAFLDAVHRGEVAPRSVGAWYNPARLARWFEKWVEQFTDTELMIGASAVGVLMVGLVFWLFCTGLPEGPPEGFEKEEGEAGTAEGEEGAEGAEGDEGDEGAAPGVRRRKPAAEPRVVEDDSE